MADHSTDFCHISQYLTNGFSQEWNSYSLVAYNPDSLELISNISTDNYNIRRLNTKLQSFFQDHPKLITDIKDYFYDEVISYIVKRSFKILFNRIDINETERLLNNFFNEHELNLRIIFDYFFDDIKPFLQHENFPHFTLFRILFNIIPTYVIREIVMVFLKRKGAQFLTPFLYQNNLDQNMNENLSEQPQMTSNHMKVFIVLSFFILLCLIFGWDIFGLVFFVIGLIYMAFVLYRHL